jgi:hypothetical protein
MHRTRSLNCGIIVRRYLLALSCTREHYVKEIRRHKALSRTYCLLGGGGIKISC